MKRKNLSSSSVLFPNGNRGQNTRSMCLSSKYCNQEDVVEEILLRLRVKPLHRCMALSKSLCSLISSNHFNQKYRKSRMGGDSKILMGFFHEHVNEGEIGFVPTASQGKRLIEQGFDVSFSFLEPSHTSNGLDSMSTARFSIVASSNGFLLCREELFPFDGTLSRLKYYVCNPLTRQKATLPNSPDTELMVAFETFICHGDGYPCLDWVTYKVVCGECISPGNFKVEIFSSQTGQWVALQLSTTVPCVLFPIEVVVPVMSESETVCLCAFTCGVAVAEACYLVFNAKQKTNKLQIVKLLKPGYDVGLNLLSQSQGFIYTPNIYSDEIQLWQLNEDKEIWVLKYSVNFVEMFSGSFQLTPYFLGLDPSNSAFAVVVVDSMIALVDIKKKSYVFTSTYPDHYECYRWHPYQSPIGIQ